MKESKTTFKEEQRFADWLSKMPLTVRRIVVICGFKFSPPRWWGDQNKLTNTTRAFKFITLALYGITIALAALTLATNNKNKEWDLYTFNENGDVEWVSQLKKLK